MTETKPTSPVTSTRAGEEMIQAIFDAIAAATRIDNDPDGWHRIVIDAAKFIEVFNSHCDRKLCTSLVEPSLLGRETVREALEGAEQHLAFQHKWLSDQFEGMGRIRTEGTVSAETWDQIEATYSIWKTVKRALASLSPLKD